MRIDYVSNRRLLADILWTTMPLLSLGILPASERATLAVPGVTLSFIGLGRLFIDFGLVDFARSVAGWVTRAVRGNPVFVPRDPTDLTDESNWRGAGPHELTLELRPRDDARLDAALKAVWRHAAVEGCYDLTDDDPKQAVAVPVGLESLQAAGQLRGIVRLPSGARCVCAMLISRWADPADGPDDPDRLIFYVPYGALVETDPAINESEFDRGPPSISWRGPLDDWLADVAIRVHGDVPISRGEVGLEDIGHWDDLADGIPKEHRAGYLIPDNGGLIYHRATS